MAHFMAWVKPFVELPSGSDAVSLSQCVAVAPPATPSTGSWALQPFSFEPNFCSSMTGFTFFEALGPAVLLYAAVVRFLPKVSPGFVPSALAAFCVVATLLTLVGHPLGFLVCGSAAFREAAKRSADYYDNVPGGPNAVSAFVVAFAAALQVVGLVLAPESVRLYQAPSYLALGFAFVFLLSSAARVSARAQRTLGAHACLSDGYNITSDSWVPASKPHYVFTYAPNPVRADAFSFALLDAPDFATSDPVDAVDILSPLQPPLCFPAHVDGQAQCFRGSVEAITTTLSTMTSVERRLLQVQALLAVYSVNVLHKVASGMPFAEAAAAVTALAVASGFDVYGSLSGTSFESAASPADDEFIEPATVLAPPGETVRVPGGFQVNASGQVLNISHSVAASYPRGLTALIADLFVNIGGPARVRAHIAACRLRGVAQSSLSGDVLSLVDQIIKAICTALGLIPSRNMAAAIAVLRAVRDFKGDVMRVITEAINYISIAIAGYPLLDNPIITIVRGLDAAAGDAQRILAVGSETLRIQPGSLTLAREIYSRLGSTICAASAYREARIDTSVPRMFMSPLLELCDGLATCHAQRQERPLPVGLIFAGPPGSGKSTAVHMLLKVLANVIPSLVPEYADRFPAGGSHTYAVNRLLAHWDGFCHQAFVHVPELWQGLSAESLMTDATLLIGLVDSEPYPVPGASLTAKGQTAMPLVVTAATNDWQGQLDNRIPVLEIAAVWRRYARYLVLPNAANTSPAKSGCYDHNYSTFTKVDPGVKITTDGTKLSFEDVAKSVIDTVVANHRTYRQQWSVDPDLLNRLRGGSVAQGLTDVIVGASALTAFVYLVVNRVTVGRSIWRSFAMQFMPASYALACESARLAGVDLDHEAVRMLIYHVGRGAVRSVASGVSFITKRNTLAVLAAAFVSAASVYALTNRSTSDGQAEGAARRQFDYEADSDTSRPRRVHATRAQLERNRTFNRPVDYIDAEGNRVGDPPPYGGRAEGMSHSRQHLLDSIQRSAVTVQVLTSSGQRNSVLGFAVSANYIMCPAHVFGAAQGVPPVAPKPGVWIWVTTTMGTCKLNELTRPFVVGTTDACLIRIQGIAPLHDIVKLLQPGYELPACPPNAELVVVRRSTAEGSDANAAALSVHVRPVTNLTRAATRSYSNGAVVWTVNGGMSYTADTALGECGSLIVADYVVGMHLVGRDGDPTGGGGMILTAGFVADALARMQRVIRIADFPVSTAGNAVPSVAQCDTFYTEEPLNGAYAARTKIRASELNGLIGPVLYEPVLTSAKIDTLDSNLEKWRHLRVDPLPDSDLALVRRVLNAEFTGLAARKLRNLSVLESINGTDGMAGINMSTGPGFPWSRESHGLGKRPFYTFDEFNRADAMKAGLAEAVIQILEDLRVGVAPCPLFVGAGKDETRPPNKGLRIIWGGPIHVIHAQRILLGDFTQALYAAHNEGPSVIGINPFSDEWDRLQKRLAVNERGMDVDTERQEMTINHGISTVVSEFIADLYEDDGWRDSRILLMQSLFSAVRLLGRRVFRTPGGNASGQGLTAPYATLCNVGTAGASMSIITGLSPEVLAKKVPKAAYGDDLTLTVPVDLEPVLTFPALRADLFGRFAISITTSAKDGTQYDLKSVNELTMLSRPLAVDAFGVCTGAKDPLEVEQPLNWVRKDGTTYATFLSVLTEFRLHGRDGYDRLQRDLLARIARAGCCIRHPQTGQPITYVSYDDLDEEHIIELGVDPRTRDIVGSELPDFVPDGRAEMLSVSTPVSGVAPVAAAEAAKSNALVTFVDAAMVPAPAMPAGPIPPMYKGVAGDGLELMRIDRSWQVGSYTYSSLFPPDASIAVIDLWAATLADPFAASQVFGKQYFNLAWRVEVRVAAASFYQGELIIASRNGPGYENNSPATLNLAEAAVDSHVFLDVASSSAASLIVPFYGPSPAQDAVALRTGPRNPMGTVYITVANVLRNTSGSLSGAVSVTVHAQIVDYTSYGKTSDTTLLTAIAAAAVTLHPAIDGRAQMLGGAVAAAAAAPAAEALAKSGSGLIAGVTEAATAPVARTVAAATNAVAGAVSSVVGGVSDFFSGRMFGLDQPTSVAAPTAVMSLNGSGIQMGRGLDNGLLLATGPGVPTSVTPALGGDVEDVCTLDALARTPGLLTRFVWSSTAGPGVVILRVPVNPKAIMTVHTTPVGEATQPTPLCMAAWPFRFWRGDLTYIIRLGATALTAARMRVEFVPARGTSGPQASSMYVDVQGSQSIAVTVPFTSASAWAVQSCGDLLLTVVNSVTTSELTSNPSIDGTVYVMSSRIQFASPGDGFAVPVADVVAVSTGVAQMLSTAPSSWPDPVSLTAGGAGPAYEGFGFESAVALRDMLHRPQIVDYAADVTPGSGTRRYALYPYGGVAKFVAIPSTRFLYRAGYSFPNAFTHFGSCYSYWSGPMRLKLLMEMPTGSSRETLFVGEGPCVLSTPGVRLAGQSFADLPVPAFLRPTAAFDVSASASWVQVEQPFNTPLLCLPTGAVAYTAIYATVPPLLISGAPTSNVRTALLSAGDSFTYYRIRSPPMCIMSRTGPGNLLVLGALASYTAAYNPVDTV